MIYENASYAMHERTCMQNTNKKQLLQKQQILFRTFF